MTLVLVFSVLYGTLDFKETPILWKTFWFCSIRKVQHLKLDFMKLFFMETSILRKSRFYENLNFMELSILWKNVGSAQ